MSISPSLISYDDLSNALEKADASFQPAEVHGYLCGLLCGSGGKLDNSWLKVILKKKNAKTAAFLQEVLETSYHLISEFSFEFALLLPNDEVDINLRSESLGAWCQGFLAGLQKFNVPIQDREPSDLTDALNDLVEIAQVGFGDIANDDEDENAYFELVEYVRLAVLMIFHELNAHRSENSQGESNDD